MTQLTVVEAKVEASGEALARLLNEVETKQVETISEDVQSTPERVPATPEQRERAERWFRFNCPLSPRMTELKQRALQHLYETNGDTEGIFVVVGKEQPSVVHIGTNLQSAIRRQRVYASQNPPVPTCLIWVKGRPTPLPSTPARPSWRAQMTAEQADALVADVAEALSEELVDDSLLPAES